MSRKFTGGTLVIASHNPGKVREIGVLLGPLGADVVSAADLGLPEPEETGVTFAENAELKARAAAIAANLPALADDSGLEVAALGGAPGLFSARWAGPDKDFGLAMSKVNEALNNLPGDNSDRQANFICVLSLCWPDGHCETFAGRMDGTLVWPRRGSNGFGYDSMFVPDGHTITNAEMDPNKKQAISHRADAFAKLVAACFTP